MTPSQIEHLENWLDRNPQLKISIGTWGKRKFLRLMAIEPPLDDDNEVFYIPLNVPRETEEMN